jgi:hypothetical protein
MMSSDRRKEDKVEYTYADLRCEERGRIWKPCPICGYEYEAITSYCYLRSCPRCGYHPEEWPIDTVIFYLSRALNTSQGKIRKVLAKEMGVEPETLKRWQYRGVRKNLDEVIDRFGKAVRVFINREENRGKIEAKTEKYEKWYNEEFKSSM